MPSDLAFRGQLVVQDQRKLYDYWQRSAHNRRMPSRADIDPVALAELLPGVSILSTGSSLSDITFRLAGTRLRDVYGTEVTGLRLFGLDLGDKLSYWTAAYERVVSEGLPMQGAVRGPLANRDHIILFWLRLPLSANGADVDSILCYDIAVPVSIARDTGTSTAGGGYGA